MGEPRLMTRDEAAAYLNVSLSTFSNWQTMGRIPGPVEGTARWDRKAIDYILDNLSGLPTNDGMDAYERWKQGRAR